MGGYDNVDTTSDGTRYWDYSNSSGSSGTGGTGGTFCTSTATNGTTYGIRQYFRRFVVTHHPFVTEELRARLTQIVNDETTSIGHIELWIHGTVDVVDFDIEIRTWENFLPLLRSMANKKDWDLLQDFLGTVPAHSATKTDE